MKSQSFVNRLKTPTKKGSQVFLFIFSSLGKILTVSKGRDKFLGLIQHVSDLYKLCMIDYLSGYRIKEWPISVKNALSLQSSIKSARKFLRLLKWVEEMGRVEKNLKKKVNLPIFLKIVRYCIGIFYFIIDNILWFVHIGVTSDYFNQRLFEKLKDGLSLIRYLLRMSIFLLTIFERKLLEKKLFKHLHTNINNIEVSEYETIVLEKLLATRKKIRFQSLEMIINVLRIIMLVKSLKLPGYKNISPIFSSNCGIISGAFSLFKLLTRSNLS